MKVLTALNSAQDADEILRWLSGHGVKASVEGKQTHMAGMYVPNGLTICVHIDEQYSYAKKLLQRFEHERFGVANKRNLLDQLKAKRLDKLFVGAVTLLIALGALWIISSVT